MAGGTFKVSQPKIRPGVYVNVKNGKPPKKNTSKRGVAAIPLIGYDWGPREEWIKITATSPDGAKKLLGRSIYADNTHMRMLRLLFKGATTVWVFITGGGAKATGTIPGGAGSVSVSAKYSGTFGNTIKLVSVANPVGGFDVSVYANGSEVEFYEGIEKAEELSGKSEYVDITGTGVMTEFASVSLTGGTNTEEGNASVMKFLDMSEKIRANEICFPTEDEALQAALKTKIRYIREGIGWKCQGVAPNFDADYEGIINVVNSFEYEGKELTTAEACAWVAGMSAGADFTESLTYAIVEDATKVAGELSNEEAEEAVKNGQTYFSVDEEGAVILEYDINSKVTFKQDDPTDINKNRPMRVYDTLANDLLFTFRPGKFDVDPDGFKVMNGIGRSMLKSYEDVHAIKNVDLENDFQVDEEMSSGDSVYAKIGIQPVDSADKYYFEVLAL